MASTKDLITQDKHTQVVKHQDKQGNKFLILVLYTDPDSDAIMFRPVLTMASVLAQLDDVIMMDNGVITKPCDCGSGFIVKTKHAKTRVAVATKDDGQLLEYAIIQEATTFRASVVSSHKLLGIYPKLKISDKVTVETSTGEVKAK